MKVLICLALLTVGIEASRVVRSRGDPSRAQSSLQIDRICCGQTPRWRHQVLSFPAENRICRCNPIRAGSSLYRWSCTATPPTTTQATTTTVPTTTTTTTTTTLAPETTQPPITTTQQVFFP